MKVALNSPVIEPKNNCELKFFMNHSEISEKLSKFSNPFSIDDKQIEINIEYISWYICYIFRCSLAYYLLMFYTF